MGQGSWGKVIETQFTGSFHDKKKQDRRSKLSKQRRRPRPVVPVTPKQMRDAYLRRKHIAHKNHAVFGEDRREPVKVLHIDPRLPPPPPHPEPHHPKQSRIVSIQEPHKPPPRVSHNHNTRPKFPVHPGIKYGPAAIPR